MLLRPEAIVQSEILSKTENKIYQIVRAYSQARRIGMPVEIHTHNVTIRQIAQEVLNLPESAVFGSEEYESYLQNIYTVISHINKKLQPHGLIIRSIMSVKSETRYYLDSVKKIALPVTTLGFKNDALFYRGKILSNRLFLPLQMFYYMLEFLSVQDDILQPLLFSDNELLSFLGKKPVQDLPLRNSQGMLHLQNAMRKLKLKIKEHNLPVQIEREYMEGEVVQLIPKT